MSVKEFCELHEIKYIHIYYKGKKVGDGNVKTFHSLFLSQDIYENFKNIEIINQFLIMEVKTK